MRILGIWGTSSVLVCFDCSILHSSSQAFVYIMSIHNSRKFISLTHLIRTAGTCVG